MAKITWRLADGSEISAEVENGSNLMEAALDNDVPHILGDCGGCLACATCHVFVDEAWLEACGEPSDEMEEDLLDMTDVPRKDNSRLSCQLVVNDKMDGLILHVPE